jgi:N-acetylneuraminic acid mutarotase
VFVTDVFTVGNYAPWKEGPALPAARSKPAVAFLAGSIYAVGGYDASGAPTASTYVLTPDASTGAISAWKASTANDLPEARGGASLVAAADGLILVGGVGPSGQPTNTVWKATLDSSGKLGAWKPANPMVGGSGADMPRADATAVINGDHLYVYGGRDANGPTTVVMRGDLGTAGSSATPGASASPAPSASAAAATQPLTVLRWGQSTGAASLPVARTDAAGFSANGGLYLVGGSDGTAPKGEVYWAIPDAQGNIPEWKHLGASDLPAAGLAGSGAVVAGPNVFAIGGRSSGGVITGAVRANLAPQPPFFQLGLIGATVPALKIEGEVGQQLGYLSAAGAGTVNFIILILIGWAMAHKERTRELWGKVWRRGRRSS